MKRITIKSPAKINLTLDVFAKKPNEHFHELETIYHLLDFSDTLKIEEFSDFSVLGDFDFPLEKNLIFKAWELVKNTLGNFGKLPPVRVSVVKNIPVQAGLGGGSSNFSAFLSGYFKLFGLGNVLPEIIEISSKIGKDIPFFLHAEKIGVSCLRGTHFGEKISSVDFLPQKFIGTEIYLYIPEFKNPTAEAFGQLKKFSTPNFSYTRKFLENPDLKRCGNTFDQLLEQDNYSRILPHIFGGNGVKMLKSSDFHLAGSGSVFFSFEKFKIPECRIIKSKLCR